MSCFFFHEWTKWSEPYKVPMIYVIRGTKTDAVDTHQKRFCLKCNQIEVREI